MISCDCCRLMEIKLIARKLNVGLRLSKTRSSLLKVERLDPHYTTTTYLDNVDHCTCGNFEGRIFTKKDVLLLKKILNNEPLFKGA